MSAIKFALAVVPIALMIVLGMTGTAIVWLPHDFYLTYFTIITSKRIGPRVKCVIAVLALPALLLWVPLVFIVSVGVLLGLSIGYPVYEVADKIWDGKACDPAIMGTGVFSKCVEFVKDFWEFNSKSYFEFLEEMRSVNADGSVFEIYFSDIQRGVLIGLLSMLIDGVCISCLAILKLVPGICRVLYELTRAWMDDNDCCMCVTFPVYVVLVALTFPGCIILCALCCVGSFIYGLNTIISWYTTGLVSNGIRQAIYNVFEFDTWTTKLIFGSHKSIVPCMNTPPKDPSTDRTPAEVPDAIRIV